MAPSRASVGTGENSKTGDSAFVYCEGSPTWSPDSYISSSEIHARAEASLSERNDLQSAIAASFSLPSGNNKKSKDGRGKEGGGGDTYVYHAIASVTLAQVQHVVSLGGANGLRTWYYRREGRTDSDATPETTSPPSESVPPRPQQNPTLVPLPPPPQSDIESYLSIFSPTTSTPAALKTFSSNAKKGSLRSSIAEYLLSKRFIHPHASFSALHKLPRSKTAPYNPYFAFLGWACRNLEWAGPLPDTPTSSSSSHSPSPSPPTSATITPPKSHHVLPILMHHFGCVCPSYESLEMVRLLASSPSFSSSLAPPTTTTTKSSSAQKQQRTILDVGSGNGYWTYMLRRHGLSSVVPIDNAQSAWRVNWVADTLVCDGEDYLLRGRRGGNRDKPIDDDDNDNNPILLLVYPIVGTPLSGVEEGSFTRRMIAAYDGDTVIVAGTQNHNGYTGFRDVSMDEFMAREHGDEWVKVVQIPLPSFPGKDEAMFVFQRGERIRALEDHPVNGDVGRQGS